MARCEAEMCPYWDGHGCPCEEFGIDRPRPGADPFGLPSATYERVEFDSEDGGDRG